MKADSMRSRLLASTMICGAAFAAAGAAYAQDAEVTEVVVTGSRIVRQDYVANSPISTVTGEQTVANADITLDTYLNTLPQVNPSGTTTSNNPGNGGQSNIDLRGLGANRNVVLVDGRRPMVSANNLTVDLNTIPQALIESIEVITGGAGAAYGADAIAGAVNVKLKRNFEGVDIRANYSNSTEFWDAEEYQLSAAIGGNFADGKGNAVFGFDRSYREAMLKSQRAFSQNATSTTSFLPEGNLFWASSNAPTKAALDTVFAGYGVTPAQISLQSGTLGFNLNGSLFYRGVFNNPLDVQNFKYPIDGAVNQSLYPDLYSYNFDFVNILTLPLDRYSFMTKVNYELDNGIEFFASAGWTEYNAATALAPTPFPTVNTRNPSTARTQDVISNLVTPGQQVAQQLVIPTTNPFIPADLRTLLNSRTGDDAVLVGAGATEPFRMRQRSLDLGLRQSNYENTVVQFLAGVKGPVGDTGFTFEASVSEGRTEIDQTQTGNLNTQRLQTLIEAADGGASICAGGFNIFGRQPISAACRTYLASATTLSTAMTTQIAQGYVTGKVAELPAGDVAIVLGAEYRGFEYNFDPGSASGPISGFNTQNPDRGTNSFKDVFGEIAIPLVKDQPFVQSLELALGARYSQNEFADKIAGDKVELDGVWAYKAELNWEVNDLLRARASYQRSVRAPNFSELFSGGGSAPQYFDPCSVTSQARKGANAAQVTALCQTAGFNGGVGAGAINTFVQTPGSQIGVDLLGNKALKPEEGSTFTAGLVWKSPWENQWLSRLQGSIDYYNIKISDAILTPTPNQIVAACYNYYGTNPTYSRTNSNCDGILRTGADILWVYNPNNGYNEFTASNGGHQKTSGIDFQFDYGFDLEWFGAPSNWGTVRIGAVLTHVIEFKQQDPISGVPELDFAGTVSYFGAGLGTSFPDWKATINTNWSVGDFKFDARARYIAAMENRLNVEFPGETQFTGPDAVWYLDLAGTYALSDNVEFKLGVNNVFNKEAESYAPNVQSGTDPSSYDVIGRRVFGGIKLRF
ncbi:TonB-dependent receptor domain-containing protein [Phenylobacterium sp.]|uniref:TonB-dependent receptor domain-containing protein n=1 Tax=Phenylobacterium sp. TaxID=1871053 RepID=UPI002732C868|nr:TonB-dependent receptor [Phenylobacterium sp.]MDP3633914.1 TonB-dependent receptor [Phenylobacterium sp.]